MNTIRKIQETTKLEQQRSHLELLHKVDVDSDTLGVRLREDRRRGVPNHEPGVSRVVLFHEGEQGLQRQRPIPVAGGLTWESKGSPDTPGHALLLNLDRPRWL